MYLSETWFMEGFIDFELQKYRLLAFLQEVNKYFNETKLYPQLADTIFHYNNIVSFRDNKRFLQDQFPKRMDQVNLQKLEVAYESILKDDGVMEELEKIAQYAIDELKTTIDNGANIYDFVEKHMQIQPVGIVPFYKNEGYILLQYGNYTEIRAYAYNITLFKHQNAKYKGIRLTYLQSWKKSFVNTCEHIKLDIIRGNRILPNPAVYSIQFPYNIPLDETLLPVAKRQLVRYIDCDKAV